jgi:lactose/L-arabinose transport system ATP-binding protein
MVFQSYALYPHMTARENLSFGLRMTGNDRADTERRVAKAALVLKIEELLDRRPKALSGGQRQRVAIGRAIVREPEVFLFDEPLSNLDAELRVQMRVEIAGLHRELGTTMIYVTHDQVEAMTLASRIVVLRAGRIEQVGRPLDLYDDPDNRFVAGFVGSPAMNFLPARVAARGERHAVVELAELPGTRIELPLSLPPPEGTGVMLGVRPEHFGPQGAGDADIRLEIDVAEHLGSTSYAYAHVPGGQRLVVQRDPHQRDLSVREVVHSIPAGRCFLFDTTGDRIR